MIVYTLRESSKLQLKNNFHRSYRYPSFYNLFEFSLTSTKAFTKNVLTLGYLTSIFGECSNSRIKSFLDRRALSLSEIRDIISFSDDSM